MVSAKEANEMIEEGLDIELDVKEESSRALTPLEQAVGPLPRRLRHAKLVSAGKTITRRYEKLGRNDPCWCGSNKKYKRCHEHADRIHSNIDSTGSSNR